MKGIERLSHTTTTETRCVDNGIEAFARRPNLREYYPPDDISELEKQPMYQPSTLEKLNQRDRQECRYKPSTEPYVNSYVESLKQDIKKEILQGHRFIRDNLNRRERPALKRLSNNRDIVIKPADKEGGGELQ